MTFEALGLIEPIIKATTLIGYKEATPIQEKAIPLILEGKDILGSAQTGTGKTAAFAMPILQHIYASKKTPHIRKIKALVITPTRELATQIGDNFSLYAKYLGLKNVVIYGGVSQRKQEHELYAGADILVATPGRLLDLMNQGLIRLSEVDHFVLDEADQMLDMGFIHDVHKIIEALPEKRQTMLFSATMPKSIEKLANQILNDPVRVLVAPVTKTLDLINQSVYHVSKKKKAELLKHLIKTLNIKSALVFTRTKSNANRLVKELMLEKINAEPIHGNKSQAARERALANFKSGKTSILVATDIAARGLDIEALPFVFNYELPEVPETYIHRIGRTGRKGLSGMAIAFCDPLEKKWFLDIEKHINMQIDVIKHPYEVQVVEKQQREVNSKKANNKHIKNVGNAQKQKTKKTFTKDTKHKHVSYNAKTGQKTYGHSKKKV